MYNIVQLYALKIHSFSKKRARKQRSHENKTDRAKDWTRHIRLLTCISRRYFSSWMMCTSLILWKVRTLWKFCFFLLKNDDSDVKIKKTWNLKKSWLEVVKWCKLASHCKRTFVWYSFHQKSASLAYFARILRNSLAVELGFGQKFKPDPRVDVRSNWTDQSF
jgi:hypothetical protein